MGADAPTALGWLAGRTRADAAGLRRDPGRHPHPGGDRTGRTHARRPVRRPVPARPRRVRPAGDRGPARRAVREAAHAAARDRGRRADGVGRGEGRLRGGDGHDPAAGRRGKADAAVRVAVSGDTDLPGHALAADVAAHRRDRRRLAGHELRPRSGGRLPRPPRRGPCGRRPHTCRPRRLPGRRGGVRRRRGRARPHDRRTARGARVQPRRHGLGEHELLLRRLRAPGLVRGGRASPSLVAGDRWARPRS